VPAGIFLKQFQKLETFGIVPEYFLSFIAAGRVRNKGIITKRPAALGDAALQ